MDASKKQKSIALIGLMGAGKSRIGRELADVLGLRFADADREIELAAGCTVAEIFERFGEPAFRDGERRVILRLLKDEGPLVLATGGGAFMNADIRKAIGQDAVSVWLKADVDLLLERTGRTDHRPLLKNGDPRAVLERLMEQRYPVYATADITVESGKHSPRQLALHIAGLIRELP